MGFITAVVINGILAVGIVTALALVMRIPFRLRRTAATVETLHPSQPIARELAQAA